MLIKKNKAKIIDQRSKIIRKYTTQDRQLEIDYTILNGRSPGKEEEFSRETKIHFNESFHFRRTKLCGLIFILKKN